MEIDGKIEEMVKEYFTKTVSYEWRRLKQDPHHQIKFNIHMYFLEKGLQQHTGSRPEERVPFSKSECGSVRSFNGQLHTSIYRWEL